MIQELANYVHLSVERGAISCMLDIIMKQIALNLGKHKNSVLDHSQFL